MKLLFVPPFEFAQWLPRVAHHLARMAAGSDGCFLAEDIAAALGQGRMQLWLALDGDEITATVVTEIVAYPRRRACRFVGCVGRRWRDWMGFREHIRAWARARGCDRMEALCASPKFRLIFPDYRPGHVFFVRDA